MVVVEPEFGVTGDEDALSDNNPLDFAFGFVVEQVCGAFCLVVARVLRVELAGISVGVIDECVLTKKTHSESECRHRENYKRR